MPEASASDFLTISQASRALGVPERSARRAADKLADNDRQKAANGRTLVRLSALASQMGLSTVADNGGQTAPNVVQVAEKLADKESPLADNLGQESATVEALADKGRNSEATPGGQGADGSNHRSEALIEQLRSENAYLKAQADKWQEQAEKSLQLVDQAQRLQLAAQHRVAELEGKLLPPVEQKGTPGASGGDSGGSVALEGELPSQTSDRAPGRWWEFWKGRG